MSAGSRFGLFVAVGMLLAMMIGCRPEAAVSDRAAAAVDGGSAPAAPSGETDRVVMSVSGMSCPLCAHNIDQQLRRIPGVRDVSINLGTGDVTAVVTRGAALQREPFAHAIEQSGFTLMGVRMPGQAAIACAACTCESSCGCAPAAEVCGEKCRCST